MASPVVRFRIDFAEHAEVGPGKIKLLEAIRQSGSLSQAARDLGMSYRRAWMLIASLNASFKKPVTRATAGGRGGGGAALTLFGEQLIESYRLLDKDISALAARRLEALLPSVAQRSRPRAKSTLPRRSLRAALTPPRGM
jgi:molybdate transport system regulatory protein